MKSEHFFVNSLSPARQRRNHHHQSQQHQPKTTSFDFERTAGAAGGTPFRSSQTNSLFGDNLRNRQFSGCSDKDSVCSASGYSATRGKRLKSRQA